MESLFGKRDVNTVDLCGYAGFGIYSCILYARALGYATMEDPIALQAMLEEADKDPVTIALAAEDRSVKIAFIQEIEESVEETRQISTSWKKPARKTL